MARNVNMLLDSLVVDSDYKHTCGNTEPSILKGLFGNISFVAWTGFEDIVENTIAVIERISDEDLEEVNKSLYQARKFIDGAKRNHKKSVRREQERQALHVVEDLKNSSIAPQSPLCDGEGSTAAQSVELMEAISSPEAVQKRSGAKRSKPNPWYERKSVTNSTSISSLHHYVMDALRDFLEVMYPNEDLRVEQRSISCGKLLDGTSEDMLHRFMKKIIPPPIRPEKTTRSSDGSAPSNEADITGQSTQRKSPRAIATRVRNSPSIVDNEEDYSIPVRPLIPLNQTPDQCLYRNTVEESSEVSVCCYEFKGPTLDLSGLLKSKQTDSTDHISSAECEGAAACGRDATEDRGVARSDTALMPSTPSRNTTNEDTRDAAQGESSSQDDIYIYGASAIDVAEHYQNLFSVNPDHDSERGSKTESKLVVLPIAQVICQAILSKAGCVFLKNHQMSFALRVEEDSDAKGFGAKVFVTGAIPSDKMPGQVAALVAFTKYCLDRVSQKDTDSLLNPLRRLIMGFSYKAFHADIEEESLDPTWCPGDAQSNARGNRSSRARKRSTGHNTNQANRIESMNEADSLGVVSGLHSTPANVLHHSEVSDVHTNIASSSETSSVLTESHAESMIDTEDVLKPARSKIDERLQMMFSHSEGVLATGASGVVTKAVWDGFKVATKMWNGHTRDGFLNLRREIKTYQRLQEKCEALLGYVLPKFLLGWDRPEAHSVYRRELILITEFVGKAIWRNMYGRICLEFDEGHEALTKAEEHGICEAALLSLSELHNNGFIHGDIALRNMRVVSDRKSKCGWRVWWLDLGRTLEISSIKNTPYFNMDVVQPNEREKEKARRNRERVGKKVWLQGSSERGSGRG